MTEASESDFRPGDVVEGPRGPIELVLLAPYEGKEAWLGKDLEGNYQISESVDTEAGGVFITSSALKFQAKDLGLPQKSGLLARFHDYGHDQEGVPTPYPTREIVTESVISEELAAAERYIDASMAESTARAYASHWGIFEHWCRIHGADSRPASPSTVAVFLASEAEKGLKPSTLTGRLAAIHKYHQMAGYPFEETAEIRQVMAGIRRVKGTRPKQPNALTLDYLKLIIDQIDQCPSLPLKLRDKALLLLGFHMAARRSEVCSISLEDLVFHDDGLEIILQRSKGDQEGQGRCILVPYAATQNLCGVQALKAWLDYARIVEGPVFRGFTPYYSLKDKPITPTHFNDNIVKKYVKLAGLDPVDFSSHSLRAGWVSEVTAANPDYFNFLQAQKHVGHKNPKTTERYIRPNARFASHPGKLL